jgi:LPS sulfotransferase NodH
VPAEPPPFDRDAIGRLLWYAEACEAGWRDWFATHSVEPLEMVYEDLIEDVDQAARTVAAFLRVGWPPRLGRIRPRMQRQADHHTERLAELFNRHGGTRADRIGLPPCC